MSLADPLVFKTEQADGSVEFTISIDDDDHKFSASQEDGEAVVSYQETLIYRGEVITTDPREEIWRLLMQSDEMTAYLEANDLDAVRRQR